jgi:hypothetical protein
LFFLPRGQGIVAYEGSQGRKRKKWKEKENKREQEKGSREAEGVRKIEKKKNNK